MWKEDGNSEDIEAEKEDKNDEESGTDQWNWIKASDIKIAKKKTES